MDKQKMDEIYRENAAMVYRYLSGLTQDGGLAEELTQETFFQAVKGIDRFRGDCKISVWLCGIAKNLWYKELEKRKRRRTVELDDATREVMYLRLAGDLPFSEIAAIVGKTENWARVTYYRGKQKIMEGMKEWNEN